MNKMQKGVFTCIQVLDAVRARVTEILQSEEAQALGRKVQAEAGKEKAAVMQILRRKALRVVEECEKQLAIAKTSLGKKKENRSNKKNR